MADTIQPALIALATATTSVAASGPLLLIFNELGLVLFLMGAAGGGTYALISRVSLRPFLRSTLIGGLLGFGFGVLSPLILKSAFGVEGAEASVQGLGAASFVIGLFQERAVAFFQANKGKPNE